MKVWENRSLRLFGGFSFMAAMAVADAVQLIFENLAHNGVEFL